MEDEKTVLEDKVEDVTVKMAQLNVKVNDKAENNIKKDVISNWEVAGGGGDWEDVPGGRGDWIDVVGGGRAWGDVAGGGRDWRDVVGGGGAWGDVAVGGGDWGNVAGGGGVWYEEFLDRHCAFCYKLTPAQQVKLCGQCLRRAYCSDECQDMDWKPKTLPPEEGEVGVGQGHASWCGLEFGEEDLDWVIGSVEEKADGIIAKCFMPAKFRIIVDKFSVDYDPSKPLGRGIKMNHKCDANAANMVDPEFSVMVSYAQRDIYPGEEICFNYTGYNRTYAMQGNPGQGGRFITTVEENREVLEDTFGIICPDDCCCRNVESDKWIERGRQLMASVLRGCGPKGEQPSVLRAESNLATIRLLEANHFTSWQQLATLEMTGFVVAVQQAATMEQADAFIKEAHEIWSNILHPQGIHARQSKALMEDPSSADTFLYLDM